MECLDNSKESLEIKKAIENWTYAYDQDMNYYLENYDFSTDKICSKKETEDNLVLYKSLNNNDADYDADADFELGEMLKNDLEELKNENFNQSNLEFVQYSRVKGVLTNSVAKQKYDTNNKPYYDNSMPNWYIEKLQRKIKEAQLCLKELSEILCWDHATKSYIKKMEQIYNSPVCELDPPKHPPFSNSSWNNYWKFNCIISCKKKSEPKHTHSPDCEVIEMRHNKTSITTKSENILDIEFPSYIMHAVQLFQQFVECTAEEKYYLESCAINEKPLWSHIELRCNYKNELMMIVHGREITPLFRSLKQYFKNGPGQNANVVSLFIMNSERSEEGFLSNPVFVNGQFELQDKIGCMSLSYSPETSINFNAVEIVELKEIMFQYLDLTKETFVLEIGCGFGLLSLMLASTCNNVLGLDTLENEIEEAEELKYKNDVHNASFITCKPEDIQAKCLPLIQKCRSVAILNLATTYGKNDYAIFALRKMATIWRVAVYGSSTKESFLELRHLTNSYDSYNYGERFLPVRVCILDTLPSDVNSFNIVILFERKPLIKPILENISLDSQAIITADADSICIHPNSFFKSECQCEIDHFSKGKKVASIDDSQLYPIIGSVTIKQEDSSDFPIKSEPMDTKLQNFKNSQIEPQNFLHFSIKSETADVITDVSTESEFVDMKPFLYTKMYTNTAYLEHNYDVPNTRLLASHFSRKEDTNREAEQVEKFIEKRIEHKRDTEIMRNEDWDLQKTINERARIKLEKNLRKLVDLKGKVEEKINRKQFRELHRRLKLSSYSGKKPYTTYVRSRSLFRNRSSLSPEQDIVRNESRVKNREKEKLSNYRNSSPSPKRWKPSSKFTRSPLSPKYKRSHLRSSSPLRKSRSSSSKCKRSSRSRSSSSLTSSSSSESSPSLSPVNKLSKYKKKKDKKNDKERRKKAEKENKDKEKKKKIEKGKKKEEKMKIEKENKDKKKRNNIEREKKEKKKSKCAAKQPKEHMNIEDKEWDIPVLSSLKDEGTNGSRLSGGLLLLSSSKS